MVSRGAQVDTTTSLHPRSYGSSLCLKNVMVASGNLEVPSHLPWCRTASRGRGQKLGDRGELGGRPETGEASPVSGDDGDGSGNGTTFQAGGSRRRVSRKSRGL